MTVSAMSMYVACVCMCGCVSVCMCGCVCLHVFVCVCMYTYAHLCDIRACERVYTRVSCPYIKYIKILFY